MDFAEQEEIAFRLSLQLPSIALNHGKLPGHSLLAPCISSNMFSSFKGRIHFDMLNNMSMRTCTTLHATPATSIEEPCADLLSTFRPTALSSTGHPSEKHVACRKFAS